MTLFENIEDLALEMQPTAPATTKNEDIIESELSQCNFNL